MGSARASAIVVGRWRGPSISFRDDARARTLRKQTSARRLAGEGYGGFVDRSTGSVPSLLPPAPEWAVLLLQSRACTSADETDSNRRRSSGLRLSALGPRGEVPQDHRGGPVADQGDVDAVPRELPGSQARTLQPRTRLAGENVGDEAVSPEMATPVQELVNRPGWSSGNAMVMCTKKVLHSNQAARGRVVGSVNNAPAIKLLVNFTTAAPTAAPTTASRSATRAARREERECRPL